MKKDYCKSKAVMSYSSKAIMSPFIKFLLEEVQSFEGNIYDTKRGRSFAYNEAC